MHITSSWDHLVGRGPGAAELGATNIMLVLMGYIKTLMLLREEPSSMSRNENNAGVTPSMPCVSELHKSS